MLSVIKRMIVDYGHSVFEIVDVRVNLLNKKPVTEIDCVINGIERKFYSIKAF